MERMCNRCRQLFQPTERQAKHCDHRCKPCAAECARINWRQHRAAHPARVIQPVHERFTPVPEAGCWLWTGAWASDGYARMPTGARGRTRSAHRYFYEKTYGPIPAGMCVCHKCDTPVCVNPDHLFLGTRKDNTHDMLAKGRAKPYGCLQTERTRLKYQAARAAGGAK